MKASPSGDVILPVGEPESVSDTSRTNQGRKQTNRFRVIVAISTGILVTLLILASQPSIHMPDLFSTQSETVVNIFHGSVSASSSWCKYGSLPGTWVSDSRSSPGEHWHTLDDQCQLKDMLSVYAGSHVSMALNSSSDPELQVLDTDSLEDPVAKGSKSDGPLANIMFIGDSVDRHILQ